MMLHSTNYPFDLLTFSRGWYAEKRAALFKRGRFSTAGTYTLSNVDDQVDEMPLTSPPAKMSP